jgi:23S rRNA (adenine2030-N6)-methyltransferase
VEALSEAEKRFAGGIYLLWYPIKELRPVAAFRRNVAALGLPKALAVELMIRGGEDETRLNGAGLIVVNAPFTLAANLKILLPELARVLAQGKGADFRLEELGSEGAKGGSSAL